MENSGRQSNSTDAGTNAGQPVFFSASAHRWRLFLGVVRTGFCLAVIVGGVAALTMMHSSEVKRPVLPVGNAVFRQVLEPKRIASLAERKVKSHESMNYFLKVLCQTDTQVDPALGLTNERALKKVQALYEGQGHGWVRLNKRQESLIGFFVKPCPDWVFVEFGSPKFSPVSKADFWEASNQ